MSGSGVRTRGGGREEGSIATVTLLSMLAFLAVAGAALVAVADLSVTSARARAAAEAAALAGAGTSFLLAIDSTDRPDAAARKVASANGAVLVRSDMRGWPLRYGAVVEIQPRTAWVRTVVGSLRHEAVAAVRPRVPSPVP